jgi:hypothetical protein
MVRTNLSIQTSFAIEDVWIAEEAPFEVIAYMNISYNVTDAFAAWQRNAIIRSEVPVEGIFDPAYAAARHDGTLTTGREFKKGAVTAYLFTNTTFTNHYQDEAYIYYPKSPSVLQRFIGDIDNQSLCCGIESIVRSQQLVDKSDPFLANYSFVDWQFFLRSDPKYNYECDTAEIARFKAPDFPDQLMRLDSDHLYNVYNMSLSKEHTCSLT